MNNSQRDALQRSEALFRQDCLQRYIPEIFPAASASCRYPSQDTENYWHSVIDATRKSPIPTDEDDCGKWLLFTPIETMDSDWFFIRLATQRGLLGHASKISTNKPNPNAFNSQTKVICVYTVMQVNDQNRVLQMLRALGFRLSIPYKTDMATKAGLYSNRGSANICARTEHGATAPWWKIGEKDEEEFKFAFSIECCKVLGIVPSSSSLFSGNQNQKSITIKSDNKEGGNCQKETREYIEIED